MNADDGPNHEGVSEWVRERCAIYQCYGAPGLLFSYDGVSRTFTLVDAHFVLDFAQRHAVRGVTLSDWHSYGEDGAVLDCLKQGFATRLPDVEVRVKINPVEGGISSVPFFASWLRLATTLYLDELAFLRDADFGHVVDLIVNDELVSRRLKTLSVFSSALSSRSFSHATRLLQGSKLKILSMEMNDGLLDDQVLFQSFCNDGLKNSKHLIRLGLPRVNAATIKATVEKLTDVLSVNAVLTSFGDWYDQISLSLLRPALQRNIQLGKFKSLSDGNGDIRVASPSAFWSHMEEKGGDRESLFCEIPDLTVLYQATRTVTVVHGKAGAAATATTPGPVQLLVEPLLQAMMAQDKKSLRRREEEEEGVIRKRVRTSEPNGSNKRTINGRALLAPSVSSVAYAMEDCHFEDAFRRADHHEQGYLLLSIRKSKQKSYR